MVVTVDETATRAAVEVLRQGGNAVDAAVAAALMLAVTFPEAGNLGGGGFLLLRTSDGTYAALDFRETAPRDITPEHFLGPDGRPDPQRIRSGGLAVAVPGTPAGLAEAHARWGRLAWSALVEPAIVAAREGVPVTARTAHALAAHAARLERDPEARALFFRDGRVLREGERMRCPALATTLEWLAREGPRAFYEGPVAEAIVRTVRGAGGVLALEDLAAYRPVWRRPVEGRYRGYRVVSFPPPSSGGVVLLEILGMLEPFDLGATGFGSSLTVHRMVEAEKRAYADRARWLGDPDRVAVPVERLLDPDYLAARARTIRDRRATPARRIHAGKFPETESSDTTHLSIADAEGNVVALTTTLNSAFGAALFAEGTGILLNNEMDDFALAPGVANLYGLVGGAANAVTGGARPLSSMAPTIVEAPEGARYQPFLVLGSPGGATIITSVLQVIVNVVDHGMELQEAVDAPRFHHQWLPDRLDHEPRAFPADVARALVRRGHRLHEREWMGNVSAIARAADGTWLGAADPRRAGCAQGL